MQEIVILENVFLELQSLTHRLRLHIW